jgi:AMMECR1 domain-containing protein
MGELLCIGTAEPISQLVSHVAITALDAGFWDRVFVRICVANAVNISKRLCSR